MSKTMVRPWTPAELWDEKGETLLAPLKTEADFGKWLQSNEGTVFTVRLRRMMAEDQELLQRLGR